MRDSKIYATALDKQPDIKALIYFIPLFLTFDLIFLSSVFYFGFFVCVLMMKMSSGFKDVVLYGFIQWVLLLSWSLIKVFLSIEVDTAAYYCLITVIAPFFVFFIFTNLNLRIRDLDKLFHLLFLSGVVLALYSIYSIYTYDFNLKVRVPSLWIHYNLVAGYFMILIVFNLSFLVNTKNKNLRLFYITTLIFNILGLFLTQTRGIWLSTMVALIFYIVRKPKLLIPISIMIVILFLAFYGVIMDKYSTVVNFNTDISSLGRLQAWLSAVLIIKDNPIFGFGFDAYRHLKDNVIGAYFVILPHPHNTYLTIMLELGLIGLVLYLGFYFKAFYYTFKIRKLTNDPDIVRYADGLQLSLLGFIIAFMFEPYFTILGAITYMIWILIAIAYYFRFNIESLLEKDSEQSIILN